MSNQEILADKVTALRYRRKLQMLLIAREYHATLARYTRSKKDIPRHTTNIQETTND